jgi:hypothetical protein
MLIIFSPSAPAHRLRWWSVLNYNTDITGFDRTGVNDEHFINGRTGFVVNWRTTYLAAQP